MPTRYSKLMIHRVHWKRLTFIFNLSRLPFLVNRLLLERFRLLFTYLATSRPNQLVNRRSSSNRLLNDVWCETVGRGWIVTAHNGRRDARRLRATRFRYVNRCSYSCRLSSLSFAPTTIFYPAISPGYF